MRENGTRCLRETEHGGKIRTAVTSGGVADRGRLTFSARRKGEGVRVRVIRPRDARDRRSDDFGHLRERRSFGQVDRGRRLIRTIHGDLQRAVRDSLQCRKIRIKRAAANPCGRVLIDAASNNKRSDRSLGVRHPGEILLSKGGFVRLGTEEFRHGLSRRKQHGRRPRRKQSALREKQPVRLEVVPAARNDAARECHNVACGNTHLCFSSFEGGNLTSTLTTSTVAASNPSALSVIACV